MPQTSARFRDVQSRGRGGHEIAMAITDGPGTLAGRLAKEAVIMEETTSAALNVLVGRLRKLLDCAYEHVMLIPHFHFHTFTGR
jgi:hypothetical protein